MAKCRDWSAWTFWSLSPSGRLLRQIHNAGPWDLQNSHSTIGLQKQLQNFVPVCPFVPQKRICTFKGGPILSGDWQTRRGKQILRPGVKPTRRAQPRDTSLDQNRGQWLPRWCLRRNVRVKWSWWESYDDQGAHVLQLCFYGHLRRKLPRSVRQAPRSSEAQALQHHSCQQHCNVLSLLQPDRQSHWHTHGFNQER